MTPARLASLAGHAGDLLHPSGPAGPFPFGTNVPIPHRNAVYLVSAWSGRILYVGSTTVGLNARFAGHLADTTKTLDWATVNVIPLRDHATVAQVRRVEGRVGLVTNPSRNKALPRIA